MHDLALLALDHAGQHRLRHDEGRGEIGGNDRVPILGRKILQWSTPLNAGVVDQNVDATMTCNHRIDAGKYGSAIDDIERLHVGLEAFGDQRIGGAPQFVRLAAVEHDRGAGLGESAGNGEAKATIGAGNQSHTAIETECLRQ